MKKKTQGWGLVGEGGGCKTLTDQNLSSFGPKPIFMT